MTECRFSPWRAGHIGEGEYRREVVFDGQSGQICELTMNGALGATQAAHIVRACNGFDDLYAALERVCNAVSPDVARHVLGDSYAAVLDDARAVLAFVKAVQ